MKQSIFYRINFIAIFFLFLSINAQQNSTIPKWAEKAIWYQIFPERFSNGDKSNDPKPIDTKGAWPYKLPKNWEISNWFGDWYELQEWEKSPNANFYEIAATRRYGGDLQGVIDKLDYLENLGITAIYLNPLFESPSLHKYDATMYRHIDNNFGPNPEMDKQIWETEIPDNPATWKWTTADSLFLALIKEAHKRNIKIIIDGVFNHVGKTFWAFRDVVKNQKNSKYKDWFYIKRWDNPETAENEFDYRGWYGVKDLPELKEDENGLIPEIRKHIFNIVKRWGDPNGDGNPEDGIDGWRLDVADMVNINFWKDFRKEVKKINPNAYLTGEVWWEDWSKNKMYNASPWLGDAAFDGVMNYRFARAVKRFIADKKLGISAKAFADSIRQIYSDYGYENSMLCMNLLDSHDTERLASIVVNPDHYYDHNANPSQNPDWKVRKPNALEMRKIKLMIALQMTLPGAPMIYYGDEAGMWGGDDPDDRKPMLWPEYKYEDETHHPFGKKRPRDKVTFDYNLFNWYKKLIKIRKENLVLSTGKIEFLNTNNKDLLVFKRFYKKDILLVLTNKSPKTIEINFLPSLKYYDLITNSFFDFELKPFEVVILQKR